MFVGIYTQGLELEKQLRADGINATVYSHNDFVRVELIVDFINMAELTEHINIIANHFDVPVQDVNWAVDPFDADNFVVNIVVKR